MRGVHFRVFICVHFNQGIVEAGNGRLDSDPFRQLLVGGAKTLCRGGVLVGDTNDWGAPLRVGIDEDTALPALAAVVQRRGIE